MVSQAAQAATTTMTRIQAASTSREGSSEDGLRAVKPVGKRSDKKLTPRNAPKIGVTPRRSQWVRLIRLKTQEDSTSWLTESSTRNLAAQATIGRNNN